LPKVKIVSVLADNRPGTLAKICAELARIGALFTGRHLARRRARMSRQTVALVVIRSSVSTRLAQRASLREIATAAWRVNQ